MADLLTPLQTRITAEPENHLVPVERRREQPEPDSFTVDSPGDVLKALQSKPDLNLLTRVLDWLDPRNHDERGFNIKVPSPEAAQIIFVLVNEIVSDYWSTLNGKESAAHSKQRRMLIRCLNSVAGMGAIVARLRSLSTLQRSNRDGPNSKKNQITESIEQLLHILDFILKKDDVLTKLWDDMCTLISKPIQRMLLWRELTSLLASGRLLSVVAEACDIVNDFSTDIKNGSWLGDGSQYAAWLGRSVGCLALHPKKPSPDDGKAVAQFLSKTLTLGYTDQVTQALFSTSLAGSVSNLDAHRSLLHRLQTHEQRSTIFSILRIVSRRFLPASEQSESGSTSQFNDKAIGGIAALMTDLVGDSTDLRDALQDWLLGVSGGGIGSDIDTRRAVIASISVDQERVRATFQKALQSFGEKLSIKHTPILHQEGNSQVLLLLAGCLFRTESIYLSAVARSSLYINAISNRLAASSQRARFLGMIVGTAISELVDPKDKQMSFSAEEIGSTEGRWYQGLTKVHDTIGLISDLKAPVTDMTRSLPNSKEKPQCTSIRKHQTESISISKIISIEEIYDESDSEDEDLVVYEKPDSDDEDDDEDPTLVQRNKPTAPVYIRDLIAGLRDTENYDRHRLAVLTASSLIRRKASFGKEVSDHLEELATLLVGLSDKYNMERFQTMRLQGMIAVLIAHPSEMGKWFSKTYFNGDYSMGQRASILTTLSMGARELAGFNKEDAALTGADAITENSFPSKKLPDRLHKIYAINTAPVTAVAQKLERTMIKPMAMDAADRLTGPNALKVRTFSSRMEVEKKRKKAIPNELAKIVSDGFFFPLTGRWRLQLQTYGDKSVHSSPFLLTHFLKTLSLILHASGASTLSLPQMTSEFWDLLLSLRHSAINDITVLEALLFAFLTLLEINEDKRRIAEEHAKELLETQSWVEQVFEKIGGGSQEGERVRMLAAGVLMRAREVVEKHQRLLMGDLVDFM